MHLYVYRRQYIDYQRKQNANRIIFISLQPQNHRSMSNDILRIIEGGLNNDKRKIINYATRLATQARADGDEEFAKCIMERIESTYSQSAATADAIRMIPFDIDSKMQMVQVVPEDSTRTEIILSDMVEKQVNDFINIICHSEELELAGVNVNKTLLLYGAPGCGKTSIAHYISEKTKLPLVVARLDGLVSSLLGSTAKNIRRIFNYASSIPCILFLDEFDAIAKARDDNHELGELKRVINSLLQNIDELPSSCVLVAATNYPELLDKAVWRRFLTKVEVGMPSENNRLKIIVSQLKGFESSFASDSSKMKALSDLMSNMSPSDMATLFTKVKVNCIIQGTRNIEFEPVLASIYENGGYNASVDDYVRFLNKHGVTQVTISKMLEISLRQIRNILNEK